MYKLIKTFETATAEVVSLSSLLQTALIVFIYLNMA